MFTQESFNEYFQQLLQLEQMMHREASELAAYLPEGKYSLLMRHVAEDEARHVELVKELIRLSREA
jgi:hypothetical protein